MLCMRFLANANSSGLLGYLIKTVKITQPTLTLDIKKGRNMENILLLLVKICYLLLGLLFPLYEVWASDPRKLLTNNSIIYQRNFLKENLQN